MNPTKLKEISELVSQLNEASDAYYNGRGEKMTDYEWDAAFDRLKQLEAETGVILPQSPTHRVSADNLVGQKEDHEYPALSLAKTKKVEDLVKWSEGRPVWLSWKLDGLTLVVTYDGGRLTKVVTRGHTGTNITHLAKAIGGILLSIPYQGHLVVRGEAVISYKDFEQFNLESDEEYANPRNLASGSMTLKDVEEVKLRHIRWIPFTLVYTEVELRSWGARMDWLESQGFTTVERELIVGPNLINFQEVIDRWTERVTAGVQPRKGVTPFPYPVDGLVIGYDEALSKPLNLSMERGQKIVLTGANGIGKTTLLKSILGLIPALNGGVELGDYLEIGYFEQEMDQSVTTTCIEEIWKDFPSLSQYEVRSALAKCGLTTKHIESKVKVLSGGEQAKVRLCKLINKPTNILLLDEPTNHLDVDAKSELKRALMEYKGSILMVCHEPDFYDGLATDVWDCSEWSLKI